MPVWYCERCTKRLTEPIAPPPEHWVKSLLVLLLAVGVVAVLLLIPGKP